MRLERLKLLNLVGFCVAFSLSKPLLAADPHTPDSSHVFEIEEVVVTASPKENTQLRHQPLSSSRFGEKELTQYRVQSVKGVADLVPNLYMPDYGSRLTSAIYVRGVGSRMNTPAVGLYVDNIPYVDKSAYDFDFLDVARVDVLRGPQGTLYGRGSMGGLLRIFTADPFDNKGTFLKLGASTRQRGRHIAVTTYLHPHEKLALSLGGFYKGDNGFRQNTTTGAKADGAEVAGARLRLGWKPATAWSFDYTASFQWSDEQSNPYVYEGSVKGEEAYTDLLGKISQNRQSDYSRALFNTGLSATWKHAKFTLTSITAYQFFSDQLLMDQDYLRADIFSLDQQQRAQNVSEELSLKGKKSLTFGAHQGAWEWTAGAFFLYNYKHTDCPVNFFEDGVAYLNGTLQKAMPPFIHLYFTDARLPFMGTMSTPGSNAAVFHQSTFNDFFADRLSLTVGLRADYDHHRITLHAPAFSYGYRFMINMPEMNLLFDQAFSSDAAFSGTSSHGTWQLLPKLALKYELPKQLGHLYLSLSKGYRSGGYNLENYSDLSQSLLRRNMMLQVKDYSRTSILGLDLPPESRERSLSIMTAMMDAQTPDAVKVETLAYKPESSWNYEAGTHLSFFDGALYADAALFWLETHNLQMAKFAEKGFGREIVNAGASRTFGGELALRAAMLDNRLSLTASYGYSHSIFTTYVLASYADYTGNYVPFAPLHTMAVSAQFSQPLTHKIFKAVSVGALCTGAGKIYWDEANSFSRPFAAQLQVNFGVELPRDIQLNVWAKNVTQARYKTFSFDSMQRRFSQYGDPFHLGVDVSWKF